MGPNARGALLALVAFGIYASHDAVVKTLGGHYAPQQMVFFSTLFGFPLVTLLMIRDTQPGTLIPVHPWWMTARTIASVITALTAFYAFSHLPLAQTYAIIFASPLLITILAIPILGETVRLRRGIAVMVGLLGVLIVIRPGGSELTLGHAAALVAAVGGAVTSVIVRKIGNDERPIVLLLYPMLANLVVMALMLPSVYRPMQGADLVMMGMMSVLGGLGGLVIIAAYKAGEAMVVAPMQYSQILWAILFSALFFGESIDAGTAIGAGIVIASGLYIVLREGRSGASRNRPVLNSKIRPDTGTTPRPSVLLRLAGIAPRAETKADS